MPAATVLALGAVLAAACQPPAPSLFGGPGAFGGDAALQGYPLDSASREAPARGTVACPDVPIQRYRGARFRYAKPVQVHPAFAVQLRKFEDVVVDVATRHYGRAPVVMRHAGARSCRRIGGYRNLLSEHAFGNGIDVVGFDFAAVSRRAQLPAELPRHLRRSFNVSLAHWGATEGTAALHARFLDDLARTLVNRRDVFRVLLGPAYPGHRGHFHFDVAPYRVVAIWSVYDQVS